jgi:hypothetical protein
MAKLRPMDHWALGSILGSGVKAFSAAGNSICRALRIGQTAARLIQAGSGQGGMLLARPPGLNQQRDPKKRAGQGEDVLWRNK